MGYMVKRKFVIHPSYLNALDSDTNVTVDRHVPRMGSRRVEVEMFGEKSWKKKMEGEEL